MTQQTLPLWMVRELEAIRACQEEREDSVVRYWDATWGTGGGLVQAPLRSNRRRLNQLGRLTGPGRRE